MTALIILASVLFAMLSAALVMIVFITKANQGLRTDILRLKDKNEVLVQMDEDNYERVRALYKKIHDMEQVTYVVHKDHEMAIDKLHRIIGDLLLKQEEEDRQPLRLVKGG